MSLSDPDRKRLWGRAGERCAICNKKLTKIDGHETIGGQEAHIRSKQTKGPRHDAEYPTEEFDTYDNMILLCQEHHTLVDSNVEIFPTQELLRIKNQHEHRVDRALNPQPTRGWVRQPTLRLIENGTQLMTLVAGSLAYMLDNDHPNSEEEQETIAAFLQNIQDWGDISGDIGASGQVTAAASLHEELLHLRELGFVVLADLEDYRQQPDFVFPTIVVKVIRVPSD